MRILLATDGISPYVLGGMQRHSYFVCKWLIKNRIYVTLYHCVTESEKLISNKELFKLFGFSKEESQYLTSSCFHFPKAERIPGHYLRRSRRYSKVLFNQWKSESQSFDFIYCKGFTGLEFIKAKKRGENIPFIGSKLHGLNMYQKSANFKSKVDSFMLRTISKEVIEGSDVNFSYGGKITTKLLELGVEQKNIIELPTGIEEDWLSEDKANISQPPLTFSFVGRFDRVKGLPELYTAIKELENRNSENIMFRFAGPIPVKNQLESPLVEYVGLISGSHEMKSFLNKTDVLLCPSWSEGMPNVIIEAMSRNCAILATDTGAVSELVDSKNGLLIEDPIPKNIVSALLLFIEQDDIQLNKMKKVSIKRIKENFLWQDIAIQLSEKIQTWINSNS